jgi:hypothetical protein
MYCCCVSVVGDGLIEQEGVLPVHSAGHVVVGLPSSEDIGAVDEGTEDEGAEGLGDRAGSDLVLDGGAGDQPEGRGETGSDAQPEPFLLGLSQVLECHAESGHVVGVVLEVSHDVIIL